MNKIVKLPQVTAGVFVLSMQCYNENKNKRVDNMKHYEVVAAVIEYEDKILCMQRGKAKFEYTSYK